MEPFKPYLCYIGRIKVSPTMPGNNQGYPWFNLINVKFIKGFFLTNQGDIRVKTLFKGKYGHYVLFRQHRSYIGESYWTWKHNRSILGSNFILIKFITLYMMSF